MGTISLTLPVSGTVITAGLHSGNYSIIQGVVNGNIEPVNLKSPGAARQVMVTDGSNNPAWVAGGWHVISDQVLGGTAASISFTSIPSNFKHLNITLSARSSQAVNEAGLILRFNNVSTGTYHYLSMDTFPSGGGGFTTSPSSAINQTAATVGVVAGANLGADVFGATEIWIPNYTNTSTKKHGTMDSSVAADLTGAAEGYLRHGTFTWNDVSNSAVSRIDLLPSAGANFIAGGHFTLYGIG